MQNETLLNSSTASGFGPVSKVCIWVAFSLVMCASIIGNSLVIWIIVAHAKMRIISNFFLLNLSISDLLVITMQVVPNVSNALEGGWNFGIFYCRVSNFTTTFSISLSVFTFMAIAIERYVVIMHPLRPRPKRLAIIGSITFIWAFSALTATPPAVFSKLGSEPSNDTNQTSCIIQENAVAIFNYMLLTLQCLVPVTVVGAAYVIIGIKLWTQQPIGEQIQSQGDSINAKRRIVLMMISLVVIFALCWLPYQIGFIMAFSSAEQFAVLYFIAICSTWPNPFIYCKMNRNFRTGFKQAFRWLPGVSVDPDKYEMLKYGRSKSHTVYSQSRNNNRGQCMALVGRTKGGQERADAAAASSASTSASALASTSSSVVATASAVGPATARSNFAVVPIESAAVAAEGSGCENYV